MTLSSWHIKTGGAFTLIYIKKTGISSRNKIYNNIPVELCKTHTKDIQEYRQSLVKRILLNQSYFQFLRSKIYIIYIYI